MKIFITVFAVLVILIGGRYFYGNFAAPSAGDSNRAGTEVDLYKTDNTALSPAPVPPPQTVIINKEIVVLMTAERFIPSSITLNASDSLKFINQDSRAHWPASDAHPVHLCYPGFDSMGGVKPGESFSFKFTVKKSCGFHDHLNPSLEGTVTAE